MAVNIYMENAFDKMEWNGMFCWLFFINLDSIRFGSTRFDYVSLHLNGYPFGLFSPSQGLRQSDPLSHFLFIIGTEVVSCLLHSSLRGFKIARLNHLLFADDLVIFTHATS